MTVGSGGRDLPDVPPWFWVWVPVYLIGLPGRLRALVEQLDALQAARAPHVSWGRLLGAYATFGIGFQLLVAIAIGAGILLSFLPAIRAAHLERRFRLEPPGSVRSPALDAILEELHRLAPGLEPRVRLADASRLAFVYPAGLRRRRIAIFGGVLVLWRRDPAAARAILVHETAHLGCGDALLVGVGAPLERLVALWPWLAAGVLGLPLLWALGEIGLAALTGELVPAPAPPLVYPLRGVLFGGGSGIVLLAASLVVPVGLIWTLELAADRTTAQRLGDAVAYRRVIEQPRARGLLALLVARVAHPPAGLRRWCLERVANRRSHLVVLLVLPAAYLARFLLLAANALIAAPAAGRSLSGSLAVVTQGLSDYLAGLTWPFTAYAALALLWPWLRAAASGAAAPRGSDPALRGSLLIGLGLLALVWLPRLVPAPASQAELQLAAERVRVGQPIVARYRGLAGNPYDWISLVRAGAPATEWGAWAYLDGRKEGELRWPAPAPGRFEVRLFLRQHDGSDRLALRRLLEVVR
jgi:hypothetical protein